MSNRRRPAPANTYRTGYLRSSVWFIRRDRWFKDEQAGSGEIRCTLCQQKGTPRTLELHHLNYHGVTETASWWVAGEEHGDLAALHPLCHEWVHRLLERDTVLAAMPSRRAANMQAITRLQAKIAHELIGEGETL